MKTLLALAVALASLSSGAAAFSEDTSVAADNLSSDRLVLRTTLGDMAFAFYEQLAPEHSSQLRRLAMLGVYDKTFVYQVDPTLFVQFCDAKDKLEPLTARQRAAIRKLDGEFRAEKLHRRGALVMARHPDNPASAETSFMILLREAPELDGNNTVFGVLTDGQKVLDAIASAPRNDESRPIKTILIEKMEILDAAALSSGAALRPAKLQLSTVRLSGPLGLNVLALVLLAGGALLHRSRQAARKPIARSAAKLGVLVGFFYILCAYTPQAASNAFLGLFLFALTIGLFFWLSRFETD